MKQRPAYRAELGQRQGAGPLDIDPVDGNELVPSRVENSPTLNPVFINLFSVFRAFGVVLNRFLDTFYVSRFHIPGFFQIPIEDQWGSLPPPPLISPDF